MGPRRLIPIVKAQYLLRKTHFWVNKKPLKEIWEVILPDSICTISTGGKTLLGYYSETPLARECLNTYFTLSAFCTTYVELEMQVKKIKNKNSVPLQEAIEPHYIHYIVAKDWRWYRYRYVIATQYQLNDIAT